MEINYKLCIILGYRLLLAAGNDKVGADFMTNRNCLAGTGQNFGGPIKIWMGARGSYLLLSWVFFCFE